MLKLSISAERKKWNELPLYQSESRLDGKIKFNNYLHIKVTCYYNEKVIPPSFVLLKSYIQDADETKFPLVFSDSSAIASIFSNSSNFSIVFLQGDALTYIYSQDAEIKQVNIEDAKADYSTLISTNPMAAKLLKNPTHIVADYASVAFTLDQVTNGNSLDIPLVCRDEMDSLLSEITNKNDSEIMSENN